MNWFTELLEKFINSELVTSTFENWSNFWSLISLIVYIIGIVTYLILIILKLYKLYKSKSELQVYISKNDMKNLKFYIPTYGQDEDPCENEELKNAIAEDRMKLIPCFMNIIKKDLHGRYFIILADSGMGKSTFLRKLYIKYRTKILSKKKIMYYSLSNWRDLEDIKNVSEKHKTILLLDSLDEDQYAIENYNKRMDEIIKTTQDYYKVIITCRTQFFPNRDSEPESTRLISSESSKKSNRFQKIYLSPFSNKYINIFLFKKFRINVFKLIKSKKIINRCPDLMARPMLLGFIDIIVDNRKIEYKKIQRDIIGIYDIIVNEWIEREENDLIPRERLEMFTYDVVMYMYKHDKLDVTQEEINKLCTQEELELLNPIFAKSKSLLNRYGNGIYKFSHKSIYEFLLSKYIYEERVLQGNFFLKVITKEINDIYYISYHHRKQRRYDGNDSLQKSMVMENMNLCNMDLSNVNFNFYVDKGFFKNVILKGSYFLKANLEGVNLEGANLEGANLEGANLKGANLKGAILKNANLKDAQFQLEDIQDADLQGVGLQGVELHCRDLKNINLQGANLRKANLISANLQGVNLKNAQLQFADLQYVDLHNKDLRYVNLEGANLRVANLVGANLQGANLKDAILNRTVFDASNILYFIGRNDMIKYSIVCIDDGRAITYKEFINSEYYKPLTDDNTSLQRLTFKI